MNKFKNIFKSLSHKILLNIFNKGKSNSKIDLQNCNNILLIQLGDLQEALSITPLLTELEKYSNISISVIGGKDKSVVFENSSRSTDFITINNGYELIKQILFQLRKTNYDVIINTHENYSPISSILSGLLKAKYKIGFLFQDSVLYTHRISELSKTKNHKIDRMLTLLDPFDLQINKSDINYFYSPTTNSISKIEDYRIKHDLSFKLTVLLNISNKQEYGFWGIVNYQKLIKYITNYDVNVIVTAAIEDIEEAETIANNKHLIYYNNDFDIYSELVRNVDLVISPDAFTVQLASAFKIPVFCLFTHKNVPEMLSVPYNSDFDFALSEKPKLDNLSLGNVLNSFVPYLEYVYKQYLEKHPNNLNKFDQE